MSYSFHLWDLIAFFDSVDKFIAQPTQSDLLFRDEVRRLVTTFVRDPKNTQRDSILLETFPKKVVKLAVNSTLQDYVHSDRCKLWEDQELTDYAWVS